MKKILLLAVSIFAIGSAFAGGDQTGAFTGIQKKKDITQGGFYLHLGLASPSFRAVDDPTDTRFRMGIQPSLEIGNNFMFYKTDKFGIGMNVSWLTFGFSSKTKTYDYGLFEQEIKTSSVYLSLLKLGPMGTLAINDNMALDIFFDFAPTFYIGTQTSPDVFAGDADEAFLMSGIAMAPGVKFRFKKLCAGFEAQFGKLNYGTTDEDDKTDFKANYFSPRLMLGFKF